MSDSQNKCFCCKFNVSYHCCCCCCKVTSVVSDSMWLHRWQPTRRPYSWDSLGKNTGVGCHFLLQFMKVKSESEVAQSCPTLCDPMDCSLPGSSVHEIFQARVLEWGATAFSTTWGLMKKQRNMANSLLMISLIVLTRPLYLKPPPPLKWNIIEYAKSRFNWASLIAQLVKNPPAMQETLVWFLGLEDPLEKG